MTQTAAPLHTPDVHPATAATLPPVVKPAALVRKVRDPKPADKYGWWWGTGRRKTAVARVRLRLSKSGEKGSFEIVSTSDNPRPVEQFFSEERDRNDAMAPLKATNTEGRFVIIVRTHGGGFMGQAQAVRLGLSRALIGYDPTLENALRDAGYLTRDAREVERKKYGQAGARRRFQFSKR